jgi:hypothetical protein
MAPELEPCTLVHDSLVLSKDQDPKCLEAFIGAHGHCFGQPSMEWMILEFAGLMKPMRLLLF